MAARCRESPTPRKNAQPRGKLVALLDRMEQSLTETKWLAADTYSIADIGAVPFVERIEEEIAPDEVSAAKHSRASRPGGRQSSHAPPLPASGSGHSSQATHVVSL